MSLLVGWITNIILFVLLATVIDMLLPSSSMQKYAKMVIGLLLISVILAPVLNIFTSDYDKLLTSAMESFNTRDEKKLENLTEIKKKEIQAAQHAYILEQMAVQLKTGVKEELKKDFDLEIVKIDVAVKTIEKPELPQDLERISIMLVPVEEEQDKVQAITKIEINTEKPIQEQHVDVERVKQFLAIQWGVDKGIIEIIDEDRRAEIE